MITRNITISNHISIGQLHEALLSASIPVVGISDTFDSNSQIAIGYEDSSTAQQRGADTDAFITRFDSADPIAYLDAKVTGARLIAVINGTINRFLPFRARVGVIRGVSITGVASISIGTNSPNYDNVYAITALTGLNQAGRMINLPILSLTQAVTTRLPVYANITTAAVGTQCVLRVDLLGDFEVKNGS